jgi:hypothetical protein
MVVLTVGGVSAFQYTCSPRKPDDTTENITTPLPNSKADDPFWTKKRKIKFSGRSQGSFFED